MIYAMETHIYFNRQIDSLVQLKSYPTNILMLLYDPSNLKNERHIQRSYDTTFF